MTVVEVLAADGYGDGAADELWSLVEVLQTLQNLLEWNVLYFDLIGLGIDASMRRFPRLTLMKQVLMHLMIQRQMSYAEIVVAGVADGAVVVAADDDVDVAVAAGLDSVAGVVDEYENLNAREHEDVCDGPDG